MEGHETVELVRLFLHVQEDERAGGVVPVVVVFCSFVVGDYLHVWCSVLHFCLREIVVCSYLKVG